jgi:Na+/proline symporter
MIYGLWYAVFAEHQELDGMGKSLATSFSAAAERNAAASSAALRQYRELKYAYDRHVDVHGHWIGLAMLLIVLGIASDRVELTERMKLLLSAGLLLGSLLFPLGVLLQTYSHGDGPRAVAVAGAALVIISMAGMTVGFARAPRNA